MEQQKRPNKGRFLRNAASFSGIAIQMGATIYFGNLLGEWLDEKYDKTYFENIVTMIAVFLSMYLVILKATKIK